MPIQCPIAFPRLTTQEFGELDYSVMAHAFASHRELGRLADETIYQRDLAARLKAAGFTLQREVPITVSFRTFVKTYHLLMDPNTAFRLTALNDGASRYEPQLKRLLDHSPLKAIHWINIGREHVTFTTIRGNSQR